MIRQTKERFVREAHLVPPKCLLLDSVSSSQLGVNQLTGGELKMFIKQYMRANVALMCGLVRTSVSGVQYIGHRSFSFSSVEIENVTSDILRRPDNSVQL